MTHGMPPVTRPSEDDHELLGSASHARPPRRAGSSAACRVMRANVLFAGAGFAL
jgi:hypothetical protein